MPQRTKLVEMDLGGGITILVNAIDGDDPHEGEIGWYDDEGQWHEGLKPLPGEQTDG